MHVSSVQVAESCRFVYQPPAIATTARRILVKPNFGYPRPHPVTVSVVVFRQVLEGLRSHNPTAEILIVEGVCSKSLLSEIAQKQGINNLLDDGIRLLDADSLPLTDYPNRFPQPVRYASMLAPQLLQEVDCRITVGTFKRTLLNGKPLISASLKNLYGLFPRSHYRARSPHSRGQLHRPSVPLILQDVYGCIGHLFDGAVVDATQKLVSSDWQPDRGEAIAVGKVIWGDDPITVDRQACIIAQESIPSYLDAIDRLRCQLKN